MGKWYVYIKDKEDYMSILALIKSSFCSQKSPLAPGFEGVMTFQEKGRIIFGFSVTTKKAHRIWIQVLEQRMWNHSLP